MISWFFVVKIKYDDKTSEVTQFPDKDVVIDDYLNGKHQANASKFVPPEQHDDDDEEDEDGELFGESMHKESEKSHDSQFTRTKETVETEEQKPAPQNEVSSSKDVGEEVSPPSEQQNQTKDVTAAEKPSPAVDVTAMDKPSPPVDGATAPTKPAPGMSAQPSQSSGHSESHQKFESKMDSDVPVQVEEEWPTSVDVTGKTDVHEESSDVVNVAPTEENISITDTVVPSWPQQDSVIVPSETPLQPDVSSALAEATKKGPEEQLVEETKQIPESTQKEAPAQMATEKIPLMDEKVPPDVDGEKETVQPPTDELPAPSEIPNAGPMEVDQPSMAGEMQSPSLDENQKGVLESVPVVKDSLISPAEVDGSGVDEALDVSTKEPASSAEAAETTIREPDKLNSVASPTSTGEEPVETVKELNNGANAEPVMESAGTEAPEQLSAQQGETPALATSMILEPTVDNRNDVENDESSAIETPKEAKVEAAVIIDEKPLSLKEPTIEVKTITAKPESTKADVSAKPIESEEVKEIKTKEVSSEDPPVAAMPAPAPKLIAGANETSEEPVKPKRKRGRPPKHRPPADGAPQEKGQKIDKTTISSESPTLMSSEETGVHRSRSEMGEAKVTEKISSAKKLLLEISGKDSSTGGSGEKGNGKDSSTKPSLTIRIPNLKKVDGKQGNTSKKGDTKREGTEVSGDAEVPRGKKRSNTPADTDEPPAKRLHIHIASKGSHENLSDHSERSSEKVQPAAQNLETRRNSSRAAEIRPKIMGLFHQSPRRRKGSEIATLIQRHGLCQNQGRSTLIMAAL